MAEGMIEYARRQGADRITVDVNKENAASNAVVKKFGFKVTGEKIYNKKSTDLVHVDYTYELDLK